jgi:hypothetical protein
MRSAERDVRAIARCDAEAFGGQVGVRLFGSCADDDLRAATSICISKLPTARTKGVLS